MSAEGGELVTVELPVIRCSTCDTPWVLRACITLGAEGFRYLWQRDCRHRAAGPADEGADEWLAAGAARVLA